MQRAACRYILMVGRLQHSRSLAPLPCEDAECAMCSKSVHRWPNNRRLPSSCQQIARMHPRVLFRPCPHTPAAFKLYVSLFSYPCATLHHILSPLVHVPTANRTWDSNSCINYNFPTQRRSPVHYILTICSTSSSALERLHARGIGEHQEGRHTRTPLRAAWKTTLLPSRSLQASVVLSAAAVTLVDPNSGHHRAMFAPTGVEYVAGEALRGDR